MTNSLFDAYGRRKYVVPIERDAFIREATKAEIEVKAFCLTLAITGARISEVLAVGPHSIDAADQTIIIRTLKQRGKIEYRAIPIPALLVDLLRNEVAFPWPFQRTTAWSRVVSLMQSAKISAPQCKPKALRHGFAVDAVMHGVPLNIIQRWMGHARIETTAIYANVIGKEERKLAKRVWGRFEATLSQKLCADHRKAS